MIVNDPNSTNNFNQYHNIKKSAIPSFYPSVTYPDLEDIKKIY